MMNESIGIDDIALANPLEGVDEDVAEVNPTPTTKKKWARSSNYSVQEDEALVLAWESVSLDPAVGIDQNSNTYWKRITDHFHRNVKTPSNRSLNSLSHRWSAIKERCNRWAGCCEQIEHLFPNGVPIHEQINYTQELYKQEDKKHRPFVMFHCWALLQNNEKWIQRNNDCHPLKKRSSKSSSSEFDNEEYVDGDDEEESGRSPTSSSASPMKKKKQETERLKRGGEGCVYKEPLQEMVTTNNDIETERLKRGDGFVYKEPVQEMTTTNNDMEAERQKRGEGCVYKEPLQEMITANNDMEAQRKQEKEARRMELKSIEERKTAYEERKVAIEEEKLRISREEVLVKKIEQEHKIMFMDITSLDETQRAYVKAMRGHILASKMGRNGSRNV